MEECLKERRRKKEKEDLEATKEEATKKKTKTGSKLFDDIEEVD